MKKSCWGLLSLVLIVVLLAACSSKVANQPLPSHSLTNALNQGSIQQSPTPTPTSMPALSIPSQKATPTPTHSSNSNSNSSSGSGCITFSNDTTRVPAKNGGLAAPYGSAPSTSQAQQYAQQIFQLINHDRAACGLPAFSWNSTLASGALLHSWNMEHCGFSHTCPDGSQPCQRIANEGFAGLSDCGENIAEAAESWSSISSIQEGMAHEALGGWHRIHLFSTTLHRIGIGVYISGGYAWITEDMVS